MVSNGKISVSRMPQALLAGRWFMQPDCCFLTSMLLLNLLHSGDSRPHTMSMSAKHFY